MLEISSEDFFLTNAKKKERQGKGKETEIGMEEGGKGELTEKMGGLYPLSSILRYSGTNGPFCRFGQQFGDLPRDAGELAI